MPQMPKDPKLRQRRNKETTAASLIDQSPLAEGRTPELSTRFDAAGSEIPWHERVEEYWDSIWSSPMATEYTQADVEGLEVLMDLMDRYWKSPNTALAGEIRLQRQCYGLTPIDRRRLQWEIKRVEPGGKPEAPQRPKRVADPRSVIKAVS